jgi:hypothetical protein
VPAATPGVRTAGLTGLNGWNEDEETVWYIAAEVWGGPGGEVVVGSGFIHVCPFRQIEPAS